MISSGETSLSALSTINAGFVEAIMSCFSLDWCKDMNSCIQQMATVAYEPGEV